MNGVAIYIAFAILFPTIAYSKQPSKPISADVIQVLKIAAQDERAVIRIPDGKTQIIRPGDVIGTSGEVTEIAVDRVVIEEKNENDTEKVIIRLIDGKQKVERMKKAGERLPVMLAPAEKDVKAKKQSNSIY